MTATRRRRGRPRKDDAPATSRELPPVPVVTSEAAPVGDALSALDAAVTPLDAPPPTDSRTASVQHDTAAPNPAPVPSLESVPPPAAPGTNGNGTHGKAPPKRVSITGRQYRGMKAAQLATALAIAENRVSELETKVSDLAPLVATTKAAALDRMVGVVISALFDIAALVTSEDEARLTRSEETELGELGAPAVAPYLGEWAQHAPLLAFGAKLTTVVATKVWVIKETRKARGVGGGQ